MNHNFENRIIDTFNDVSEERKNTRKPNLVKNKHKTYLTVIALSFGFFGVLLILRGLFLFNPLSFEIGKDDYSIGINKPLNLKSINLNVLSYPAVYPRNLQTAFGDGGVYFFATSSNQSIVSFLDKDVKLKKTLSVDGKVKRILPLNNGDYYLTYVETETGNFISLLSYSGENYIVKEFDSKIIIQDLFYDEIDGIFIYSYIDNNGLYNLRGISFNRNEFDFYKGSLDENSKIMNLKSNKFYFYSIKECQELNLEDKEVVRFECKNIPQKTLEKKVLFTKSVDNQLSIYSYNQENGAESELQEISANSIIRKLGNQLVLYSPTQGLSKYDLVSNERIQIEDPFITYTFDDLFIVGANIFLKSQITDYLYKYLHTSETVSAPISYISYPQIQKLELQKTLNSLNLSNFSDFTLYFPDNIYTL